MLTIPRKAGPRAGRIASARALGADAPAPGELHGSDASFCCLKSAGRLISLISGTAV